MRRRTIPPSIATDVLAASRRRCCLCFGLSQDETQKRGQIAHLNRNPEDNDLDNLAFLCLDHHDQYDSRTSQSKGLSPDEVKRYRAALIAFLSRVAPPPDDEIASGLMEALDRPAYRTPFYSESSLPRFRGAIAETIETLNTGRTPQGVQLPSKTQIRDPLLRQRVDDVVEGLVDLRAAFDRLVRDGEIVGCGCEDRDCPVFFLSPFAVQQMDDARSRLLMLAHELNPRVLPRFYGAS